MNAEKQQRLEQLNAERDFVERRIGLLEQEIDNLKARLDDIDWTCIELEYNVDEEDI